MIKEKWIALKQDLSCFSSSERWFIFFAMLSGFCISTEYAIIRPVSNSLFIHAYTSHFLPYAWLATVPLNLLLVFLYNRFLPKFGCFRMCLSIALLIAVGNVVFALFLQKIACLPFIFYIWKETYVLLMFQQLWSLIHSTVDIKKAKYLYGILFGVGGIGAGFGCLIPGFLAVRMGSENLLFSSLPIYLILMMGYFLLVKKSEQLIGKDALNAIKTVQNAPFTESVQLITRSKFLLFILGIVVLMQFSSTIIDFQFNAVLESTISDKDLRTEYTGKILGIVQIVTVILQFVGTFLFVQFLGLKRTHLLVPATLAINTLGFLLYPIYGMIAFSYITVKSFDFSLFGVIKEMLYLPLNVDEKFRAKAFIDVFAYRSAKAIASCFILALQFMIGENILSTLSLGALLIFVAWLLLIAGFFKKYQTLLQVPN